MQVFINPKISCKNLFDNVLYNAPYIPQLNPIEFSFPKLKYVRKRSSSKDSSGE